jgi:hypothetical protein
MGAAFVGLTVPDLSLRDVGGTKVTTTVVDSGAEGPRGLERWDRTGCALSGDELKQGSGGSDERSEGAHLYRDWRSGRTGKGSVYKPIFH